MFYHCIVFVVFLIGQHAGAAENNSPKITRLEKGVQILNSPSKRILGKPPHVKFKRFYYQISQAELGQELPKRSIIQTGPHGKAKLIYPNGDTIEIGPGTMFKVRSGQKSQKNFVFELVSGQFRALISPEGPRANSEVRNRSMVMGVRGTDFFVDSHNDRGDPRLSVIRGKVDVRLRDRKAKLAEVKTGESADFQMVSSPDGDTIKAVVQKLKEGQILAIHKGVSISNTYGYGQSMMALTAKPKSKKEIELEELERKSAESLYSEIKKYDPKKVEGLKMPKTSDDLLKVEP